MLLQFKDGTVANCEVLGSVEVDGMRYAVFFDPETKWVHVYMYEKKKKNKVRLYPVTDRAQFRKVCSYLNSLIRKEAVV